MKKLIYCWLALISFVIVIAFGSCSDNPVNNGPILPSLILSVDSISVAAPYGGPSPISKFVKVSSDFGEGIEYSFSESSRWMVLSNATGNSIGITTDSFLITFRVSFPFMIDLGHYVDTITITGDNIANSPQYIVVTLDIGSNLQVAPKYLSYITALNGENPDVEYITVASNTTDSINYTIEKSANWISLSSYSGSTAGDDSIEVNVDLSNLSEGLYVEYINIYSEDVFNSPQTVVCSLLVAPWQVQPTPFSSAILLDADFKDMNNGWVVGFVGDVQSRTGVIYKTTDNGMTWDINLYADTMFANDSTLLGVVQFVNDTGWVVGERGIVLNSFNNGQSWNLVDLGHDSLDITLTNQYFITGDIGFVIGENGLILKTVDAGANWGIIPSPVSFRLKDIYFTDNLNGWICGSRGILHTVDGGASWTSQIIPSNPDVGLSYDFTSIHFVDLNYGWTVGKLGYLLYTDDGGANWNDIKLESEYSLTSIFFTNQNNGYVCGENGSLFRTIDGGVTWYPQLIETTAWLNSVFFVDDNIGWVVGEDGLILHTRSGGH